MDMVIYNNEILTETPNEKRMHWKGMNPNGYGKPEW